MTRELRVGVVMFALLLSGCAGVNSDPPGSPSDLPPTEGKRRLVVAVVDAGSSPYLPIFASGFIPPPAAAIPLSVSHNGSIEERFEADDGLWMSLDPKQLYWYEGTRLLGISFTAEPTSTGYTIDSAQHGSMTTYLVAREAPDAIIVSVQVSMTVCDDRTECGFQPDVIEALAWVAAQPWIDVVSISLGILGNAPDSELADDTAEGFANATRAAARSGKLVVVAAGNTPAPPFAAVSAGPPWAIAAGGVERNSSGTAAPSAQGVDIVSNFSENVPNRFGVHGWKTGTSLATPIVAGTLARALGIIRAHGGPDDPATLRAALNASARYFNATDWDPSPPGREPLPDDIINSASLPVLVQPQMGWGYVDGSFAEEIARRVLENDLAPPPEKQQAIVFQAQWQKAREEYWAKYQG